MFFRYLKACIKAYIEAGRYRKNTYDYSRNFVEMMSAKETMRLILFNRAHGEKEEFSND